MLEILSSPARQYIQPKDNPMDFKQLKQTRKALGLTLQAAGERVGITREAVRLAEAGHAPDAAAKLAKHYRAASAKNLAALLKIAGKPLRVVLDVRFDNTGTVIVSYEGNCPDMNALGDFVVQALVTAEGTTTKLF
jgi:transcriptional regulator with XRE-family HTH domain